MMTVIGTALLSAEALLLKETWTEKDFFSAEVITRKMQGKRNVPPVLRELQVKETIFSAEALLSKETWTKKDFLLAEAFTGKTRELWQTDIPQRLRERHVIETKIITMSNISPVCILHRTENGKTAEALKQFTEPSWSNVKEAEKLRKGHLKTSKFFDIVIPDQYDTYMCYHSSCYKDYTAVPKQVNTCGAVVVEKCAPTLRSEVDHPGSNSTGVFEPVCLFCGEIRKWIKGKFEKVGTIETKSAADKIVEAATKLRDDVLLSKISGQDLIAKEATFHHSCRNAYYKKSERLNRSFTGTPAKSSMTQRSDACEVTNQGYERLKIYVKTKLIDDCGAEKLTSLYNRYLSEKQESDNKYVPYYLCEKLLKEYPKDLTTYKSSNKEGLIISNKSLSQETATIRANFDSNLVKEAAYYLRSLILSKAADVEEIPTPHTDNVLKKGQNATPPELEEFFNVLYSSKSDNYQQDKLQRLIKSTSDDVVFNVTRGRIKPGKHICMGLGLKSLTGSRRIVEIMNRFGHSISYHIVEELETQIASEISDRQMTTPDGILKEPGLFTGLAWDNYDENTETLSGSGTLHDTVGICYQNIRPLALLSAEVEQQSLNDTQILEECSAKVKKESLKNQSKRALLLNETELAPYRKKPKMTLFEYQIKDSARPKCLTRIERLDTFWILNFTVCDHTPMWTGWNSLIEKDQLPQQRISYMENITLPPTRLDVVVETMRRSQKVAEECGDHYMAVTYDLAVAKPALQIQASESPAFDNLFICFGAFHIILSYFGALGYFLEGSGAPEILTDTEVLAVGSMNGFLKGKHFNRCTRLHQVLMCALEVLHVKRFLSGEGQLPGTLLENMKALAADPSEKFLKIVESSPEYVDVMTRYEAFTQRTLHGDLGSTAKFWMIYIKLVSIYLKFNRACRTNNLSLFIDALKDMCPIFFAMNRPNYARWMVRYYLNLLNIDKTHPGMREVLEGGALSIRRTDKNFSRTPVDMALEQTVNADAASRQTGIVGFNNSESARRRWMLTRSMRSCIIGGLLDKAGLKSKDDVATALKDSRIKRDNDDVEKVADRIVTSLNPFDTTVDDNLYCLTTGKQCSSETRNDLLNCFAIGEKWKTEFLNGCFTDPSKFEKAIPRRKLRNFAADALKTKVTSKDRKIIELQGTRDLFGRLLYLRSTKHIDLKKVFQYPLVTVPLSIGHIDGSINKTDKSSLMHKLEKMSDGPIPSYVNATFIDAVFLLHTLTNIPRTMGDISKMVLKLICGMSNVVHFICDTYITPSIKETERARRGESHIAYSVIGRDQRAPSNWQQALQSPHFKTAFFRFLASDWQNTSYSAVLHGHEIYLGLDNTCYYFTERDGETISKDAQQYHCHHEEADTRLVYHLQIFLGENNNNNTNCVIRSNDTDVLVLLLYHVRFLRMSNVWMDAGLNRHNTRRFINIGCLIEKLGSSLAAALPGLHAFTGSDYTSSFMNKGKVKPLDLMMKHEEFVKAFGELGDSLSLADETTQSMELFVCKLYGKHRSTEVNEVRYSLFQEKYSYTLTSNHAPLSNIKGLNPSYMPPCQKVLKEKVKRANYVAALWKRAKDPNPVVESPDEHGWNLSDNCYMVKWFEGDQLPVSIVDLLVSDAILGSEANDDSDELDSCSDDSEDSDSDEM